MRIAPDAASGYIDAMRGTNTFGDGKEHSKPAIQRKAKAEQNNASHHDGVAPCDMPDINPALGEIHEDFVNIGFAALEWRSVIWLYIQTNGTMWNFLIHQYPGAIDPV